MKNFFIFHLLLISMAQGAPGDVIPLPSQCVAVKDSKVYLSSDFHSYPRVVKFECTYKCNSNGRIDTLTGISTVRVGNIEDDALLPVCQGTVLKKVPWGYDLDKIVPFYAPVTESLEIKRWAFQNINFNPLTNKYEREKLEELKKNLYSISSSFIVAGMNGGEATRHFKEAGFEISKNR